MTAIWFFLPSPFSLLSPTISTSPSSTGACFIYLYIISCSDWQSRLTTHAIILGTCLPEVLDHPSVLSSSPHTSLDSPFPSPHVSLLSYWTPNQVCILFCLLKPMVSSLFTPSLPLSPNDLFFVLLFLLTNLVIFHTPVVGKNEDGMGKRWLQKRWPKLLGPKTFPMKIKQGKDCSRFFFF